MCEARVVLSTFILSHSQVLQIRFCILLPFDRGRNRDSEFQQFAQDRKEVESGSVDDGARRVGSKA